MGAVGVGKARTGGITLSPTDVATYVRLGRCDRFLAIRIRERSGINVFAEYGVAPHPVAPLLRMVGEEFEAAVLEYVARRYVLQRCGESSEDGRPKGADNARIVDAVRHLGRGEVAILAQPAVATYLGDLDTPVEVFGNIDLLRLARSRDGDLLILVVDVKRSAEARLDHHLQAALYAIVVEKVLVGAGLNAGGKVGTGILRARSKYDPTDGNAELLFGCGEVAVYDAAPDPEVYRWAAEDFVLSAESAAYRAASSPIPDALAVLGVRCDGCVNQEVCHAIAEADDDLCLVPGLSAREKRILLSAGVQTLSQFVTASRPVTSREAIDDTGVSERLMARLGVGYPSLVRRARAMTCVRAVRKTCARAGEEDTYGDDKCSEQGSSLGSP